MAGYSYRPEVMESDMSDSNLPPSAPPRRVTEAQVLGGGRRASGRNLSGSGSSGSPPRYEAVMAAERQPRGRNFTDSLAHAGATVGRFFGVHDDDLRGWNRAGTLPPNERALAYSPIGQEESVAPVITPPTISPHQSPTSGQQQGGGRLRGLRNTVTATLRHRGRGRPRDPTREEVMKTLPTFWPVMTVLIALAEVGLMVATVVTSGLAPIRFTPESRTGLVIGFDNVTESGYREVVPNFFIGTSKGDLVHNGAMYTPCMRENVKFQVEAANNRLEESNLRCCLSNSRDECGMLPQQTCTFQGGEVLGGASRCRSEMNQTELCTGGVTLHPCCVGLLGGCVVTTQSNCSFHEGEWHPELVLCSELGTDCFKGVCKFTWIGRTIGEMPSQGMRFFSAIFLYDGVVTLVIIGLFKLYNSWKIERRIGWLRVLCIYTLSGIGGFLLSGLFDPTSVSVGGTGGLFGLLGVNLVELLQGWKWVHKPCLELFKILILLVFLLFLGTLPYIDNFTQIGGFIFGVFASFIFVPYITLGKWDRLKKLCLLSVAVPVILVLFLFGMVVFYNLPDPNFCPQCAYINCIPYTTNFCDDFISTFLSPFIPVQ